MVNVSAVRFGVGILGNIISAILFISPMPTFWKIHKSKSTEGFHPYPYLAAMMNCLMWIFYGLPMVHPDSVLVITINSFGLVMEIFYLSIFFYYSAKPKYRRHIIIVVVVEMVVYGGIIAGVLLDLHTTHNRTKVVGIICIVFGTLMYASPLSTLYDVWKSKDTKYMPFWLCFAGFCNGICWFAYAFLKTFDLYIAIGNGIGAGFGALQLLVFAYYKFIGGKKKSDEPDDEVKKPSKKIQLAEV